MYEVRIKVVLNGYEVRVGCRTLVFNNLGELLSGLESYLTNPRETTKKFIEHSINSKILTENVPTPVAVEEPVSECENKYTGFGPELKDKYK